MTWHINLLTLFPEMFPGPLGQSLSGRALEKNLWSYTALNIRDFALDKHKTVDDSPFGGGAGMVMRADVIENALLSLPTPGRKIYMSPRGRVLNQTLVLELAQAETLTILCGRYEGVDQRVLDAYDFEEISIGDYVLSGGEPAAMILMDACIRLLPGVMGNDQTAGEESFSNGLLEYPHYTRPAEWIAKNGETYAVPEVLISGDHAKVDQWRLDQAQKITQTRRPDLLSVSQEVRKQGRTGSFSLKNGDLDELAKTVVDCIFQVHKKLGPGLLESVYEIFLIHELRKRGLSVEKQVSVPIEIDGHLVETAFRADLIVEGCILLELKSVETLLPVHKAQTISYLKLSNLPVGFLVNFNSPLIKDGIRRFTPK